MKKQVLFSLLFSLLTLISADAQTFFTIENNWKNTSNKDRNSPLLSIEKGQLTISSDKTIEGLCIKIKDTTGHLISQEEICLAANFPHLIPTETLSPGKYLVEIRKGDNYILGYLEK
ncbi:DUF3244 domain-containing protein [Phocaeicola faecicola]|jgi:hypothetical protein|uniref:DUF3244 domain-containing protein n=1 Tax=Phocaeicola faecicola TaxID=2739389 RepID=UPI002A802AEE|nr:DUF3244 domain-containing protein [Phocaeicola faecicola]MDD6908835.1 DUF3244 domain-containing protein [Bacteroidaceae bacterium]MDY4871807.1 DUF3244 domain-containing protein [Phocaeicola faecicola]